jgi:NADP oxidoreductase coenzyme F420-dependent
MLRSPAKSHHDSQSPGHQASMRAVVAVGNRYALQGADAVVLTLRFTVLKGVIKQIANSLAGKVVVVPSNPLSIDARGNVSRVLPEGQSSGEVVAGWLPTEGAWPWRSGPCRLRSSSPPATDHRSRASCSTRPITTGPAMKSSG